MQPSCLNLGVCVNVKAIIGVTYDNPYHCPITHTHTLGPVSDTMRQSPQSAQTM